MWTWPFSISRHRQPPDWALTALMYWVTAEGESVRGARLADGLIPREGPGPDWKGKSSSVGLEVQEHLQGSPERGTAFPCAPAAILPKTDAFACVAAVPPITNRWKLVRRPPAVRIGLARAM